MNGGLRTASRLLHLATDPPERLVRHAPERVTSRSVISAAAALGAAVIAVIVLAAVGVFSGSSTVGQVKLQLTAARTPAGGTSNAQMYPFGTPSSKPDYSVPPPPGESSLVTTVGTKTTQRIYGADPYQEAVSVTQHIWPSALPENAPNENNNVPDRPWGLRRCLKRGWAARGEPVRD
jgi:hypothetical protein